MNIEEQRLKFINTTMDLIHDLCNDLYENLVDEDFGSVDRIVSEIEEILRDINQTFQNEI
jgi:t-SNARE complex subunit (syntaxin)